VPITEDGVDTIAFLEASEGVLALFGTINRLLHDFRRADFTTTPGTIVVPIQDLLGATAFGMVIKDMSGNISVCVLPCCVP
jgi:hypothetical protein